jgi:hypothetical protein
MFHSLAWWVMVTGVLRASTVSGVGMGVIAHCPFEGQAV